VTEALARAVLVRVAEKLGGRWRAVDGPTSAAYGIREDVPRKRFRLEYGGGWYAAVFCHGDTWRLALDDYVKACRRPLGGNDIPEDLKADSAEEPALKLAVAGEILESPRA